MAVSPVIALLTDFGLEDGYPGIMKGVILGIAPEARLVDISHSIPPQDITSGAWVLHTAWRYFPLGAIFLCVVDPGVGTSRAPIALRTAGRFFLGPDNGILSYALDAALACSEPSAAIVLDRSEYYLPQRSATFHGRDVFSPCAAHLAAGTDFEAMGTKVDPARLIRLPISPPVVQSAGRILGGVAHCDHFGNIITNIRPDLTQAILASPTSVVRIGDRTISRRGATFADGPEGDLFFLADSSGYLAIVSRNGSAVSELNGVKPGSAILVDEL